MAKIIREKKPKIIQIIPAQGIFSIYEGEDGEGEIKCPVHVIGLDAEGGLELIEADAAGWWESPKESVNFLRFEFSEDQTQQQINQRSVLHLLRKLDKWTELPPLETERQKQIRKEMRNASAVVMAILERARDGRISSNSTIKITWEELKVLHKAFGGDIE